MARVLSEYVSDREARALIDTELAPGFLREIVGVVASAANQPAADTLHFVRVPSNAIVSQVLISAADATTAGAVNIGVYQTLENGNAAVNAGLFASALDLAGGPFTNAEVTFESGEYTFAESERPLWEVLGLTADPRREYDIVATITTTFNGGPTSIRLAVRYRQ
jgi:hypothetical protein